MNPSPVVPTGYSSPVRLRTIEIPSLSLIVKGRMGRWRGSSRSATNCLVSANASRVFGIESLLSQKGTWLASAALRRFVNPGWSYSLSR